MQLCLDEFTIDALSNANLLNITSKYEDIDIQSKMTALSTLLGSDLEQENVKCVSLIYQSKNFYFL